VSEASEPRMAVVTGASSGIGRAVAIAFGELGWPVAVGARRLDRLEKTAAAVRDAGGEPFAHGLDVTDAASISAFFDAAEAALGPVSVAVANAGISVPGRFHEIGASDLRREVETNLLGAMLTAQRAVASMIDRGAEGDLLFISSDASQHARPRMVAYSATKAGVEQAAHALSMELEGTGIRSTILRVGPTLTDFGSAWDSATLDELMTYWPRFGLQRHGGVMDPAAVARVAVLVVTSPPGVHVDTIEVQPEAPHARP
jgi:NADP-dependent 3-hydroxy acid dehydrogenase YdfG